MDQATNDVLWALLYGMLKFLFGLDTLIPYRTCPCENPTSLLWLRALLICNKLGNCFSSLGERLIGRRATRSAARKKKRAGSCSSASDGTGLFNLFEIYVRVFQDSLHRLIYEQFSTCFFLQTAESHPIGDRWR
jgi:hypothetical protein